MPSRWTPAKQAAFDQEMRAQRIRELEAAVAVPIEAVVAAAEDRAAAAWLTPPFDPDGSLIGRAWR